MSKHQIIVDIWGGENSQEHLARFWRNIDDALTIARREIMAGFLVNIREEAGFGPDADFDNRIAN